MRAPVMIGTLWILAGAAALSGCLVSETPVLDASNGDATPLAAGAYVSCPIEDEGEEDCTTLTVSIDGAGLYTVADDADETMYWRFRRVARNGFAMQAGEDGEDGYAYYYARVDGADMRFTFMQCKSLPESLRAQLIGDGDLSTDDEDFETCAVLTLQGLVKAAKSYHDGDAVDVEPLAMTMTLAPAGSSADE